MTAIEATFSSDQPSLLSRIGRGLEHHDRPDDETMVQVALICSAHF